MNETAVRETRNLIEKYEDRFNLGDWGFDWDEHGDAIPMKQENVDHTCNHEFDCETTACIAGWAAVAMRFNGVPVEGGLTISNLSNKVALWLAGGDISESHDWRMLFTDEVMWHGLWSAHETYDLDHWGFSLEDIPASVVIEVLDSIIAKEETPREVIARGEELYYANVDED